MKFMKAVQVSTPGGEFELVQREIILFGGKYEIFR
ncbi:hypothetical protein SBF1_1870007 [Candidatus Desulfosporosinus infrequens]|uniref:Uncharacterized protein n=1 Tax=Candidatus Desulfosporosinus infrequens TaxID=2043169 RepID=A0A2U3KDX8_9FIRM|nr:hypothetical protein SBF1_1870007 [Candidatus Desulfosporosinus infrequens]